MKNLPLVLLIFLNGFELPAQVEEPQFRSPLTIPLVLSGTFGELRGNHFHSGIDIKTQGRIGLPVVAIADGYVARVKVSPYGFGKALYLRHDNGFTSVYAHLNDFQEPVAKYLRVEQYRLRKNELNLYPEAGKISFRKGDTIAFSGNSGGSGGPHLHFEIRDTRTEEILNPLDFGFEIADNRPPELSDFSLYQFEGEELIAQERYRVIDDGAGQYHLAGDGVVEAFAPAAFGIEAIDRLDAANNRNGVYHIQLQREDSLIFEMKMDRFSFAESRYINAHIDYSQKICCGKKINKLYRESVNPLQLIKVGGGPAKPGEDSLYNYDLKVGDHAGNYASLNFKLKFSDRSDLLPENEATLPFFGRNQSNFYYKDGLKIILPEGALYRNLYFEHQRKPPCRDCLAPVHSIASDQIPVHKYYELAIRPNPLPAGVERSKLCIVSRKNGRLLDYEGGDYRDGLVTTRTRQFGEFSIMVDSVAPRARPYNFRNGRNLQSGEPLIWLVSDELSGVEHYDLYVNDRWQRLYFDAKTNRLIFDPSDLKRTEETEVLKFKLVLRDDRGNERVWRHDFKW